MIFNHTKMKVRRTFKKSQNQINFLENLSELNEQQQEKESFHQFLSQAHEE